MSKMGLSPFFFWCAFVCTCLQHKWHSRGQRFDPAYLHHKAPIERLVLFFVPTLFFCVSEHFAAASSPLLQVIQKAFSCLHNECVMNRRTPLCATLPAFA